MENSSIDLKNSSQNGHTSLIEDNNPTAQVECNYVPTGIKLWLACSGNQRRLLVPECTENPRETETNKHTEKVSREKEQMGPLNMKKELDYICFMDR